MKCQNCGASLSDNAIFCGECGSPVESKPKNKTACPRCGALNDGNHDKFCSNCGFSLQNRPQPAPAPQPRKSNTLLIVMIIIVAFLAVAILGLFTYEYMLANSKIRAIPTTQPTAEVIATPAPTQRVMETPEPRTTHPPAPTFYNVSASSTRGTDYTSGQAVNYYPEYAVDGIYETAWSSNREIELTPSITLSSNTNQYVTGVRVANGYFKTPEIYRNNRRVTKFRVEYEGGYINYYCGIDQYRVMQDIRFDEPVLTNYIKVQVLESYEGKWKDIAISEIEVY